MPAKDDPVDDKPAEEPTAKPGEIITGDTSDEDIEKFVNEELGLDDEVEPAEKEEDGDKGTGDDAGKPDEEEEESPADTGDGEEQPPVPEPKPAEESPPEPDSEEVKTDDLYIEVEDGEGKTHKFTLDSGIPDDYKFTSDKQLFEVLDAFQEMKTIRSQREAEKEESEKVKIGEQAKEEQIKAWEAEIEDLMEAGILDRPTAKLGTPEFVKDEAVQKVAEVMKYMTAENEKRADNGGNPILSFGTAFNLYEKEQSKKKEEDENKADNDEAKKRGSLVGGASAAASGSQEVYTPGQYNSIWDIPIN